MEKFQPLLEHNNSKRNAIEMPALGWFNSLLINHHLTKELMGKEKKKRTLNRL